MLQTKSISFKYDEKFILDDISIGIKEGSFTAIIGANGSGKTTLAKHFNALLIPAKGDVFVDGINTRKNPFEVRKKVGFVFQNPEDQLVNSIVEEDIAFGLENLNTPREKMQKIVLETLAELNISHLAKRNVNFLSAGQKQLVALAGVLAMNPYYIILDEPTTLLDARNKKNIFSILANLNKKQGKTIILITNLLDDLKITQDVIVLKEGKIIFSGKKASLSRQILKEAGLDE